MKSKFLVIGASGKTGKRVFSRLTQLGLDVTPASRSSAIPFDWYDPTTWTAALKGKDNIYVTFQPDLAIPQALSIISEFTIACRNANIKKIVLLSGRGEPEAKVCEDLIIQSGIDYTIVRASFFMQNFSEGFFLEGIQHGELVVPIVHAKEPFVDADDIADMVVAALTDVMHKEKIYQLTGPELLSFKEAVEKISPSINVIEVSLDDYCAMLRSYQLPEDFVSLINYLFSQLFDGRNESICGDIEAVLKRKATSFSQYVSKTNFS